MRTFLLSLTCLALAASADDKVIRRQGDKVKDAAAVTPSPPHLVTPSSPAAEKMFEIKDGDRVLFLGDTLLEREGTYGYLETRMAEQFPDRRFTVRNLAFSADTPLGWSRASFDPPAKGFERLKEQLALVKPTVVFLGYGMAASLQEMTDRSQDWTLNRDPARYGAEPMSAGRFKRELGVLMDAIQESRVRGEESGKNGEPAASGDASNAGRRASGSAGAAPAVSGAPAGNIPATGAAARPGESGAARAGEESSARAPKTAGGAPALPVSNASPVRFVLLSPIRHEDLRQPGPGYAGRPGLPDPTEHNKLLEQYSKAIEELAKERGARFVSLREISNKRWGSPLQLTDNGIHLNAAGHQRAGFELEKGLEWPSPPWTFAYHERVRKADAALNDVLKNRGNILEAKAKRDREIAAEQNSRAAKVAALLAAIIRKNALFFHRWRPANETYLFGFRKREQGQNAVEIPKFDPLIEAAEAEIERLKKGGSAQSAQSAANPAPVTSHQSPVTAPQTTLPLPTFTLADGLEISLWAENPLLAKPTECNWDAQGRLWVASSAMYPMIAPGQEATDKIIILEDPGHTGKGTKSTVFVDGLLVPTGVAPVLVDAGEKSEVRGQRSEKTSDANLTSDLRPPTSSAHWACYVGQSTELLYFEDTKGTGKADKKRIVFSGFGTEDTHHIVHTLRWGPDGRLYFSQSVYIHTHMETPWGVVRVNSGGVFAYDPRTERVEVVEKGLWNTWGHAWDQWGQSFYTDGAGSTGLSWGFPGATFAPNEGARRTMASISPGSYPKFAGLEIIYSPHFPDGWQGTAVTCDFRAHKIVHFKISDLGFQISDLGGTGAPATSGDKTGANQKSEIRAEVRLHHGTTARARADERRDLPPDRREARPRRRDLHRRLEQPDHQPRRSGLPRPAPRPRTRPHLAAEHEGRGGGEVGEPDRGAKRGTFRQTVERKRVGEGASEACPLNSRNASRERRSDSSLSEWVGSSHLRDPAR